MNGKAHGARDGLAAVIGRIPSGLFIVTAGKGADATGFLGSWIQQAGFEPPAVSVAIKRERPVVNMIERDGAFAVSVLGKSHMRLVSHFARGFAPGEPAFSGLTTELGPSGVPHLTQCVGWLDCRLAGVVAAGDHLVVVGHVLSGDLISDEPPHVHIRKSGLGY